MSPESRANEKKRTENNESKHVRCAGLISMARSIRRWFRRKRHRKGGRGGQDKDQIPKTETKDEAYAIMAGNKIILISWLVRDSQGKSVDSTIGRGPWKTFWLSTLFANELAQSPGFVSPDKGAKSNSSSSPFHFAGSLQRIRQVHVSFGETFPFADFYFV